MPKVLPSQVVEAIDQLYPHAAANKEGVGLQPSDSPKLRSLLDLIGEIPDELIVLRPSDYALFVQAKGTIDDTLMTWVSRGAIGGMPHVRGKDAVTVLRNALVLLSDERPTATYVSLSFITDADVRDDMQLDIGSAERALQGGEWKTAMITAGALIEDLLHWKLSQLPWSEVSAAAHVPTDKSGKVLSINDWNLTSMIDVAEDLGILTNADTIASARVAKNYRNLIHPGRRARKAQRPDRGKAYTAIGGMYGVLDALK